LSSKDRKAVRAKQLIYKQRKLTMSKRNKMFRPEELSGFVKESERKKLFIFCRIGKVYVENNIKKCQYTNVSSNSQVDQEMSEMELDLMKKLIHMGKLGLISALWSGVFMG